jgi:signal transduction histidine kinase
VSITKGFVDFMGGEINLQSEDGIGSEFRITLPVRNK